MATWQQLSNFNHGNLKKNVRIDVKRGVNVLIFHNMAESVDNFIDTFNKDDNDNGKGKLICNVNNCLSR